MSTSSCASQASGPRADVVRGAIEACRLEVREPAGVRLGGGGDAVRAKKVTIGNPRHGLKQQFDTAAADSKNLSERPDNLTLLKLYALYKQGTEGDVAGNLPDSNDFVGPAK